RREAPADAGGDRGRKLPGDERRAPFVRPGRGGEGGFDYRPLAGRLPQRDAPAADGCGDSDPGAMTANSELQPLARSRSAARERRRWSWLHLLLAMETLAIGGLVWYLLHDRMVWKQRAAFLHASLGREREKVGDLTGALSEYGAAVKLYPNNPRAWYLLGTA